METLRRNIAEQAEAADAEISLLQRYSQPTPPPVNEPVQYAQIIRPIPLHLPMRDPPQTAQNEERFDFRLQAPRQANSEDNTSITSDASKTYNQPMSGGSSISSGYIDLTQPPNHLPPNNRVLLRNVRPTSPETSF